MTDMKSQVRLNAERDPSYCPYCLHCRSMARMQLVEPFHWRCTACGAEHDERDPAPDPAPAPADRVIHALQRLAYEDTSLVNTPVFQARESFRRHKGFYANDPKSIVGPNNDPANPDYQRQRAVFKRIVDKFIDKWESERDQEGAS
jgi:hypothetical protein